jgi:hypothetical protein
MAGASVLLLLAAGCNGGGGSAAKPAERHLVYVRGNGVSTPVVWIADVTGAHARRLTQGSLGVLSPDGRTVAVSRGGKGIYLISSTGRDLRRLTPRALHPRAWSGDSKILFATVETESAVPALVAIDRDGGAVRTVARGSLYGFDVSPDGSEIVYSRAPEATIEGICGDVFDLYVAPVDGGKPRRLTRDGLSAFPAWGAGGIAFAHFTASTSSELCAAPGVSTIDPDGSHLRRIVARTPDALTLQGFYGFQPLAWLDDHRVLVGLRSDYGVEGTILDTKTRKLRRLNDYTDEASSDGRFSVGSGGDQGLAVTILRLDDGKRVFHRTSACCPDWNR